MHLWKNVERIKTLPYICKHFHTLSTLSVPSCIFLYVFLASWTCPSMFKLFLIFAYCFGFGLWRHFPSCIIVQSISDFDKTCHLAPGMLFSTFRTLQTHFPTSSNRFLTFPSMTNVGQKKNTYFEDVSILCQMCPPTSTSLQASANTSDYSYTVANVSETLSRHLYFLTSPSRSRSF